ncbi:MAG: hypothetical protein ABJB12_21600, partial [Pseudomonadota bacterium]
ARMNATVKCDDGMCVVDKCLYGFGCPDPDGCSTNVLISHDNCGQCDFKCGDKESCQSGACVAD